MAFSRSLLVKSLLILSCCCSFASRANAAQSPPSVIFAFGDSLTDTGNRIRMFTPRTISSAFQPYGRTYFGQPAGRYSDGRTLIDCIAQSLGLPFLNPFFDFVGTDFSNGANYAIAGATALNYSTLLELGAAVTNQYTLVDQLQWHLSFLRYAEAENYDVTRFPTMPAIRQGLYFILIGGNDLSYLFVRRSSTEILKNVTRLAVAKVTKAVQLLYEYGARNFLLASPSPMGCLPTVKTYFSKFDLDERGCLPTMNEYVRNYSISIAAIAETLSETLPNASVAFLDFYSAFDEMFTYPNGYGIVDTLNACCAAGSSVKGFIMIDNICGPMSRVCEDPSTYLNWEGSHYTDNTVRQIVNMFVEGKFIMPPDALARFGAAQISKDLRAGHVELSHSSVIW